MEHKYESDPFIQEQIEIH